MSSRDRQELFDALNGAVKVSLCDTVERYPDFFDRALALGIEDGYKFDITDFKDAFLCEVLDSIHYEKKGSVYYILVVFSISVLRYNLKGLHNKFSMYHGENGSGYNIVVNKLVLNFENIDNLDNTEVCLDTLFMFYNRNYCSINGLSNAKMKQFVNTAILDTKKNACIKINFEDYMKSQPLVTSLKRIVFSVDYKGCSVSELLRIFNICNDIGIVIDSVNKEGVIVNRLLEVFKQYERTTKEKVIVVFIKNVDIHIRTLHMLKEIASSLGIVVVLTAECYDIVLEVLCMKK